jgi:redox-sensitive bicupin YhaK (pirin superfamily)
MRAPAPEPSTAPVVLQTVPLGLHWPTVDPFLFCAHHDDAYPAGNERLGPDASLAGHDLGMDFEARDGWRMYHGLDVPGFPQHPHRGFETVTYVRKGLIDHSDSLGATARFGRGDVQWLTAAGGIVHSEMFPLVARDRPNPCELFQIWLNLPAAHKLDEPSFTMMWADDIPKVEHVAGDGARAVLTVIAGPVTDADGTAVTPPPPPPSSWAAVAGSDVAIWHLALQPGSSWTLPPAAGPETIRVLYVFDGTSLHVGPATGAGTGSGAPAFAELGKDTGAVVRADEPVSVGSDAGAECLILQGRPIGEPVAQQGPFVMNDHAGLRQAFADYQRTGFGGWPWPVDGPVHAAAEGRFAIHPDGRREDAPISPGVSPGVQRRG